MAQQARACSSGGQEFSSQYPTGRGSFGKCTIINCKTLISGSESKAAPSAVVGGRNTSTARGRASPAGPMAELRPGECEAGPGRCTAPRGQGAGRARGSRASVPRLLSLPSTLRSSSLGSSPILASPSTGCHLCSTLRSQDLARPPLHPSQALRVEGSYWAS